MQERTATNPINAQMLGKASSEHDYSDAELDAGLTWLQEQEKDAWGARLRTVGEQVMFDFKDVPPVVRHLLGEHVAAIQSMNPERLREYRKLDTRGRIDFVTQTTEAS